MWALAAEEALVTCLMFPKTHTKQGKLTNRLNYLDEQVLRSLKVQPANDLHIRGKEPP